MTPYFYLFYIVAYTLLSCEDRSGSFERFSVERPNAIEAKDIRGIPLPAGFKYVSQTDSGYAAWLLDLKFRTEKTIYLHDGSPRSNQSVQYGVLDIDIGEKDLVQCADAAIKLRADYLFEKHLHDQLTFTATSGDELSFSKWLKGTRWKERSGKLIPYTVSTGGRSVTKDYNSFMELVYSYCGTYSLSRDMKTIGDFSFIKAGDLFVEGGFPGHAVTVMAVAENKIGKKLFLLSQGYMPAQDIHLLKNYNNPDLSPWYDLSVIYPLQTPQWQFGSGSLRRW